MYDQDQDAFEVEAPSVKCLAMIASHQKFNDDHLLLEPFPHEALRQQEASYLLKAGLAVTPKYAEGHLSLPTQATSQSDFNMLGSPQISGLRKFNNGITAGDLFLSKSLSHPVKGSSTSPQIRMNFLKPSLEAFTGHLMSLGNVVP